MAFSKYQASMNVQRSPDTDSGLSLLSGTTESPVIMKSAEHNRFISSLLKRSTDSIPSNYFSLPGSYTTPHLHRSPSRTSTPKSSAEPYVQPEIALSPDMFSKAKDLPCVTPERSHSPDTFSKARGLRHHRSLNNLRDVHSLDTSEMLGVTSPDNYFTAGLKQALNESQTRRNTLLDKLREAQDTLRLQSSRLSKMELDYHSCSYQLEEMKANENKLLTKISYFEKNNKELNDLRTRDINTQIHLQERIVELESALQNIATDFQILEADHCRRRELVDQLSTTVELVEDENLKLHKAEQMHNADLHCFKKEIDVNKEEKRVLKDQLSSKKNEAQHWKEEAERQQNLVRMSQENITELSNKVRNLTLKLECLEEKEKHLIQENDSFRLKDRECQEDLMDLKSKVALLSSDKERHTQEKIDLSREISVLSKKENQLSEENMKLRQAIDDSSQEIKQRKAIIDELMESNTKLKEELLGSQKVGENLSLELMKMKKMVDLKDEESKVSNERLQQNYENISNLEAQNRDLKQQYNKLKLENEYMSDSAVQEKAILQKKLENTEIQINDKFKEIELLQDTIASLKQKLLTVESQTSVQLAQNQADINAWQDRLKAAELLIQQKNEDISSQNKKIAVYESQIAKLVSEAEVYEFDYESYSRLKDETHKQKVNATRLTQENKELDQMVQLLQTQRDIYARSAQEYSGKVVELENIAAECNKLQLEVASLGDAKATLEKLVKELKEKILHSDEEIQQLYKSNGKLKTECDEYKHQKDIVEKENSCLKGTIEDYQTVKQKCLQLELEQSMCKADKTVISHLTEHSSAITQQLVEVRQEKATLAKSNQDLLNEISRYEKLAATSQQKIAEMQAQLKSKETSIEEYEKKLLKTSESLSNGLISEANLRAEVMKLQAQTLQLNDKMAEANKKLIRAESFQMQSEELREQIQELNTQVKDTARENQTLMSKLNLKEKELQSSQQMLHEKTNSYREILSSLENTEQEKVLLENKIERLKEAMTELKDSNGNQLKLFNEQLEKSEQLRLALHQELIESKSMAAEIRLKFNNAVDELHGASGRNQELSKTCEDLRSEIREARELQYKQEDVIGALKEESCVLNDVSNELKDLRKKHSDMCNRYEEQKDLIIHLQKTAKQKEMMDADLHGLSNELHAVKSEVQKTYSLINQKELEVERLQQQLNYAMNDLEKSEDKAAELKIRMDQAEQAKVVSSATLQERIQSTEAEASMYKGQVLQLSKQLAEANMKLSTTNAQLNRSYDISTLNQESILTMKIEMENQEAELKKLKTLNAKLSQEQREAEAEKRSTLSLLADSKKGVLKLEKEKEQLEKTNNRLEKSMIDYNQSSSTLSSEINTMQSKMHKMEQESAKLSKENTTLKEELVQQKKEFSNEKSRLTANIKILETQLSDIQEAVKEFKKNSMAAEPISNAVIKGVYQEPSNNMHGYVATDSESDDMDTTPNGDKVNVMSPVPTQSPSLFSLLSIKDTHDPAFTSLDLSDDRQDEINPVNNPVMNKTQLMQGKVMGSMTSAMGEILTDSSGDSMQDASFNPELSDGISPATLKGSSLWTNISKKHGGDESISDEITADQLLEAAIKELDDEDEEIQKWKEEKQLNRRHFILDKTLYAEEPLAASSDDEDAKKGRTLCNNDEQETAKSDLTFTRDKTMKILKQLKKSKKRTKRSLAPPTKINEKFDISKDMQERKDSFEDSNTTDEDHSGSVDLNHVREDILSKSGMVEWREDPREAHKRYLSSWDLSTISDADENDPEAHRIPTGELGSLSAKSGSADGIHELSHSNTTNSESDNSAGFKRLPSPKH